MLQLVGMVDLQDLTKSVLCGVSILQCYILVKTAKLQSKGHSLGLSVTCLEDKENLELTFQSSCGNCKYRLGYRTHRCQLYVTGLGLNQCWQACWFVGLNAGFRLL
jgi:hypothetical protein